MSANSKIEWTDNTFNPWLGCTKVSPGCANCYAETLMDTRYGRVKWGKGNPRVRTKTWKEPLKWDRQAAEKAASTNRWNDYYSDHPPLPIERPRVFCASLSDWLDDEVPIEWLADLLKLIHQTPHLDWLLLTKRPENFAKRTILAAECIQNEPYQDVKDRLEDHVAICGWLDRWLGLHAEVRAFYDGAAPIVHPVNVWIGTTVEDQKRADERIPHLLKIPAIVRFLSCEPLLSAVDIAKWLVPDPCVDYYDAPLSECVHWVICGGESGPHARPMSPDLARSLRDQCAAAAVPFFFKQWGEWAPDWNRGTDGKLVARLGKRAAGRLLDGREWNQFPEVAA